MKKALSLVLVLVLMLAVCASAAELSVYHDYQTTANEMETFVIQYSQAAKELNVLTNCIDGLLTNDAHGNLIPNAAKEWSSEDGGQTWTFILNEGMKWVDYQGNVKADVVAEDWLWGLEWVLNFGKNEAANTSMPIEMIQGASEYYEYTKELAESDLEAAKALDLTKFSEMVGVEAVDNYTLVYHCLDKFSYFPTLATYNCLYPISGALLSELGTDAFFACNNETMWYSGAYTMTSYINANEKVLTKNPNYWNADAKIFDEVVIKMVESGDVAYQLFQAGELDYVALTQANLSTIYNDPSHEFNQNLVEARPTKYSYQMHFCWAKNNEDGTPDTNWNTAIANEAFRLAWYYGLDATDFLARTNFINPLNCQNYTYTGAGVATTTDGTDYTTLVLNELGMTYDPATFNRVDAEKAAAYKAQAIEELTAAGVTFPVTVDYYIKGDNQTAKDTADTLAQTFSDCLGDDFVVLNTKTYVSSVANEVRTPRLASIYINGWGADFGDPVNFVGQETYGEDNAYYSNTYSIANEATDPALIATYEEFTKLVGEAKAITDDQDARLAAFAKSEAYFIEHALTIPWYVDVSWELTCINDYTKPYAAYGIQNYRYVDWESNADIYTTAEYEEIKAAY